MDPLSAKLPWITKEGHVDPAKFPFDGILKQAVSEDESQFRSSLVMLQSMCGHGRKEAGVFLLGLLLTCEDNWEKRIVIVEALRVVETQACVDLLFGELKRVKSSNTTRRYLTQIIKVLAKMPFELVEEKFVALADDQEFSPKMRAKFRAVLEEGTYGGDFL